MSRFIIGEAHWILGFGPHAEVLEPERLREKVRDNLEAALSRYREGAAGG